MNKTLLGLAIASVMSSSAYATVDLDNATTPGTAVYGNELKASGTPAVVTLTNAGSALDAKMGLGVAITGGSGVSRYVRFTLTGGATFATATSTASIAPSGLAAATAAVISGGQAGDDFAIVEISETGAAGNDVLITDPVTLAISAIKMADTSTPVGISAATYASLGDAAGQTGALKTKTSTLASFANSYTWVFTPNSTAGTATIASDFKNFSATAPHIATEAKLGSLKFTLAAPATLDASSAAFTGIADFVATNSMATISGSFDTADATTAASGLAVYTGSGATCGAGPVALTDLSVAVAADKQSVELDALTAAGITALSDMTMCYVVDGATTILATPDYTASTTAVSAAGVTARDASGTLKGLEREGTTVQIPYITTFSDYNQRVSLVNRSSSDVAYSITFTPEAGATATAGTAASGTIPAGESVVLKAADIVTLTGKTRTAATLVVEANSAFVDVLTQTVNLSDGSTDTVVLN